MRKLLILILVIPFLTYAQEVERRILYYYEWEAVVTNNTNKDIDVKSQINFRALNYNPYGWTFPLKLKEPGGQAISYDAGNLEQIVQRKEVTIQGQSFSKFGPTDFSCNMIVSGNGYKVNNLFLSFAPLEGVNPQWNFNSTYVVPITSKGDIVIKGSEIDIKNPRIEAVDKNQLGEVKYEIHGNQPLDIILSDNNQGIVLSYSLKLKGTVEYEYPEEKIISVNGNSRVPTYSNSCIIGKQWKIKWWWKSLVNGAHNGVIWFHNDNTATLFETFPYKGEKDISAKWSVNGEYLVIYSNWEHSDGKWCSAEFTAKINNSCNMAEGTINCNFGDFGTWSIKYKD